MFTHNGSRQRFTLGSLDKDIPEPTVTWCSFCIHMHIVNVFAIVALLFNAFILNNKKNMLEWYTKLSIIKNLDQIINSHMISPVSAL